METNFFATCSFLDRCSSRGMVFNGSKFQFGEEEVQLPGVPHLQGGPEAHP